MIVLPLVIVATSFISGIFGMAGGMLLLGYLLIVMSAEAAMVLHGFTQMTSNGWLALLWRGHIRWAVILSFTIGALAAVGLFAAIQFVPDKGLIYLSLGLTPFLARVIPERLAPNIIRPIQAPIAGFVCTIIQLLAGVAGPILDLFFVRSGLPRQDNVATKAALQVIGHLLKIGYFGSLLTVSAAAELSWYLIAMCMALAVLGTTLSRKFLDRMSDKQFYRWSNRIILAVGAVYIVRGAALLWSS